MKEKTKSRILLFVLAVILLGAFLLRIQQWDRFSVIDEKTQAAWTWNLFQNPFPVIEYPPLILYFNFCLALLLKALLSFLGAFPFASEFVGSGLGMQLHMQVSRLLVAFFSTLTVYVVFRIGREQYNRPAAFLAATLLAVNQFLILNGHTGKNDTLLTLLLCLTLLHALQYARSHDWRRLAGAAFFYGLAVACKYNAALAAVVIVAAMLFGLQPEKGRWLRLLRAAAVATAAALAGFLLGAPNWLVHPLANFNKAARYVTFLYSDFSLYDKPSSTYHLYFQDFLYNFGWVFLALFIIGLLAIFFSWRKADILLAVFIAAYVGFFGRSGFYGYGTPLPVYPAMALLMAKALFVDMASLLPPRGKLRPLLLALVWLPIAVFALDRGARSLELFNTLQTSEQLDLARDYRLRHIYGPYRMASEMFTPHVKGDWVIYSNLTRIKLDRFQDSHSIYFISSSFRSDYILQKSKNADLKSQLQDRLGYYTPFHRASKFSYPPGKFDVQFWYKTPPSLIHMPAPEISPFLTLPRQYMAPFAGNPSIFLPLQRYEKNPCFGTTANGSFSCWLSSREKIERLRLLFFGSAHEMQIMVTVNGRRRRLSLGRTRQAVEMEISGIAPLALHKGYIYSLEIATKEKKAPCHVAFAPVFASGNVPLPSVKAAAPVPELFSGPYPDWLVAFFQKTGVDLSLLQYVNREFLTRNPENSISDFSSAYLPLDPGSYRLRIAGEALVRNAPVGKGLKAKLYFISTSGMREEELALDLSNKNAELNVEFPFASDRWAFFKLGISGMRENNFLLRQAVLEPDYRQFIQDNSR